jgi:hypothetical protein
MDYLIKDQLLEIKHVPGKGAWTYHLQIPNTKHLVGKWGSLKVAGFVDHYQIEQINLFSIKGQDKLISINDKIRKSIKKSGGDLVNVTLYWLATKKQITTQEIFDTFNDAGVLNAFQSLPKNESDEIINQIQSLKSEEDQVKKILKYIHQLENSK